MSGDCGHGWGYHKQGASGPCSKCEEAEARGYQRGLEAAKEQLRVWMASESDLTPPEALERLATTPDKPQSTLTKEGKK